LSSRQGVGEQPSIGKYLVGGLLGNTPLLFLVFALTFLDPAQLYAWSSYIQASIYGSMLAGGALAGYMVTRTLLYRHLAVGLVTGAFCYLVSIAYSMFLLQFLLTKAFKEYWVLFFYALGGTLGGLARQRLRSRRPTGRGGESKKET
jgi:hypothetical protein